MPKRVTLMSDMIDPEVLADMLEEKLDAQLKFIPYAHVDNTLVGSEGDTKKIPKWNMVGEAEDIPENTEIDIENLSCDMAEFTIKKSGKGVSVTQESINSGHGDPLGTGVRQVAKSIKMKLNTDILNAAYTASVVSAPSVLMPISYAGMVDANTKFLDEENGISKTVFIHPLQEATLLKDPLFVSADTYEKGVVMNGSIGKINGCWVVKSLKVRLIKYEVSESGTITIVKDDQSETATHKHAKTIQPNCARALKVGDKVNAVETPYWLNPILKHEPDSTDTEYSEEELPAITILMKKDTQIDIDWIPKFQRYEIYGAKYNGVALTNDSKVVLAKFAAEDQENPH